MRILKSVSSRTLELKSLFFKLKFIMATTKDNARRGKASKLFLLRCALGLYKPKKNSRRRPPVKPDFKAAQVVRAQHERDYRFLAREEAWTETKRLRFQPDGPAICVTPAGETWADVAAAWQPIPVVQRVKPARPPPDLCQCTSCRLAKQAERAARNAAQRRQWERMLKKQRAALRRAQRRADIPAPTLTTQKWCGFSLREIYEDLAMPLPEFCAREDTVDLNRSTRVYFGPTAPKSSSRSAKKTPSVSKEARDIGLGDIFDVPNITADRRPRAARSAFLAFKLKTSLSTMRDRRTPGQRKIVEPVGVKVVLDTKAAAPAIKKATSPVSRLDRLTAKDFLKKPRLVVEMDGDTPHEREEIAAANVVVQESQETEVEIIGPRLGNLRKYCEANVTQYSDDMDRWIPVAKGLWKVSDDTNKDVQNIPLPLAAVVQVDPKTKVASYRSNVMANALRIRQYCHSDVVVRVQINGTPFYQGQLICAWFYRPDLDDNFGLREHVCSYSYTNHVIVDAGNSNSVEMTIPYRSYRPYMNTRHREGFDAPLTLGQLRIRPLVKLNAPTGATQELSVNILCRLVGCSLSGMIPPDIPVSYSAEMLSMLPAAVKAASVLYQAYSDYNRDKPPTDLQPSMLTPIATSCLAHGSGVGDGVQPMRLNPLGQTPHPDLFEDEMQVKRVAETWGFVKTIPISVSDDKLLYCVDAAPIMALKEYAFAQKDGVNCYYLPPVSVISQLYTYWRGDIDFRLDFVATRFHQMRLWICWVPNYIGTLTYDQAVNCAGTYFDLKEDCRTVTVRVPYISDRPFWPHRYSTGVLADECPAPSQFCIYVVNKLTSTSAIANSIGMNIWVRAGPSFEVAVPCQPAIGLPFVAKFKDSSDSGIYARPGYFPWYVGTWSGFYGGTKCVLRYDTGSQHVAQFNGLQKGYYYRFEDQALAASMKFLRSNKVWYQGNQIVFVPLDTGDGYGRIYLAVCSTGDAQDIFYEKDATTRTWKLRDAPDYSHVWDSGSTSENTWYNSKINAKLVGTEIKPIGNEIIRRTEAEEETIEFESGGAPNASQVVFGETFMDLKDLCRRYQLYTTTVPIKWGSGLEVVDLRMPILPQGLTLQPETQALFNAARDGIIPIVMSGFRFYRGSLRMKVIVNNETDCMYAVQVRPDRTFLGPTIRAGGTTHVDGFLNHGYATALQVSSVNPITTLEVPMYLPGNCGLLQMPIKEVLKNREVRQFFSLGELAINIASRKSTTEMGTIDVFYSVGDDFRAHTFQGFPPMIFVRDYENKLVDSPAQEVRYPDTLPADGLDTSDISRSSSMEEINL